MAKCEPKTRKTEANVEDFISSVENEVRRSDAFRVLEIFKHVTGTEPEMWGPAIIGFGSCVLTYTDGSKLDWPVTGFSPRKQNLTLYLVCGSPKQPALLEKLGKHKTSVCCLYINRLSDIDETVLETVIDDAYKYILINGGAC